MLQNQPKILYTDAKLDYLFAVLDELHTAASDNLLHQVTPLSEQELVGWLQDLIYTAQETIAEIERPHERPTVVKPRLRVIKPNLEGGLDAS
jgi:hypothetical protein